MSELKLGYIGLGNMGTPMAKRFVDWPGGLVVFDVRPEAMTPLVERVPHLPIASPTSRRRHHQRDGAQ